MQQGLSRDVHIVAVGYKHLLACKFKYARLADNLHTTFALEVVAGPHIVVADEEIYLHSAVAQFGQFAQRAHEAFGYNLAVFIPKVEDVAHQKYGVGIFGYTI